MVGDLRPCGWCMTLFVAVQYAQKFCSHKCGYSAHNSAKPRKPRSVHECLRCGADLSHKKSHAIYCSKTCKSMDHTFKHRGTTRLVPTARRQEIIARDGSKCYRCGIDLAESEIELDHLIPVAMGGDSSPENVAVSCMPCNRSRGSKLTIWQIIKRNDIRSAALWH